jgi:hypothetical protein
MSPPILQSILFGTFEISCTRGILSEPRPPNAKVQFFGTS